MGQLAKKGSMQFMWSEDGEGGLRRRGQLVIVQFCDESFELWADAAERVSHVLAAGRATPMQDVILSLASFTFCVGVGGSVVS